jgi:hypothetical protein
MLQFRDPNRIPPQEVLDPGSAVIAIIQPDDLRRRATLFRDPEKVGIGRHDDKPVVPRIFPNRFVRCEAREASVENVDRIGEKCGQAANELGREIGVKKEF